MLKKLSTAAVSVAVLTAFTLAGLTVAYLGLRLGWWAGIAVYNAGPLETVLAVSLCGYVVARLLDH